MKSVRTPKEAMVVTGGIIAYVGTEAGAMKFKDDTLTKIVDVGGKVILPGMHDVHLHPLEAGSLTTTCIVPSDTRKECSQEVLKQL
jgi:predicted amidohydrolase YtcJ